MPLSTLLLAAIPLAWLLPNHYPPWLSAWQDGLALALLFGAALLEPRRLALPGPWLLAVAVALASVCGQWLTGRILFGGDALMVALYLAAFLLAVVMGTSLVGGPAAPGRSGLDMVAFGVVAAAVVSVGIALVQWSAALPLGLFGVDLRPGDRPYANVAQPNHLCTLVFLGLCCLGLLRESGAVGRLAFWTAAPFLLAGMVMSASRTGWVQMALLLGLVALLERRGGTRLRWQHVACLAALYALGTWLWPLLNASAQLSGGRSVATQVEGGVRGPMWLLLLHAVAYEPLWGYGWQQMVLGLQAVAPDHAPLYHQFEYSHNLALDLLLWAGIPVGGLILAVSALALWRLGRGVRDPRAVWLLGLLAGVLAHAMLEYPHAYAYFLLPAGLALGAAHALGPPGRTWQLPNWPLRIGGAAGGVLLAAIAVEYLQAEQSIRQLRLESARIGVQRIESQAPTLHLLTQLGAFASVARTEARAGMSADEVDAMRQVAQRFPYPPALLRYALAAGLNGQPEAASRTLALLCSIHPAARCREGQAAWTELQDRYPQLAGVPGPTSPP